MTHVDPQWYFDTASAMRTLARDVTTALTTLQSALGGMDNSAGNHGTAGYTWAGAYDQAASDAFEVASMVAMAADNLGEMTHKAGVERLRVENENSPGKPAKDAPALPTGSGLTISMHPTARSTGGINDEPSRWDLIADRMSKRWADCDVDKIHSAGSAWQSASTKLGEVIKAVPAEYTASDPPPEVPRIDAAVSRVTRTLDEVRRWCSWIGDACERTQSKSDIERKQIKAILIALQIVVTMLESNPGRILAQKATEEAVKRYKDTAAEHVTRLLIELDGFIEQSAAIIAFTTKGGPTNLVQLELSPLLGRYARPDKPIAGNAGNWRRGRDGERRAGLPPGKKKEAIYPPNPRNVSGRRFPDDRDEETDQIVEVKNTNETGPSDAQILDEAEWARDNGYTMTLITDHRTTLSPAVEKLKDEGRITVLRMELDENLGGQKPAPFLPPVNWRPPPTDPSKPTDSNHVGVPVP